MPLRQNDLIIGKSRGSAQAWIDYLKTFPVKRRADVEQFIRDVYTVNAADDMPDAFLVVAQAAHETGNFTNRWWDERLNAGSLGVTGDDAENEASPTFKTTMSSARAMSAHDMLYATGRIDRGGLTSKDDPRYQAYRDYYGDDAFPRLSDLSGRYAADTAYAEKIETRAAEIYLAAVPDQGDSMAELNMTKGLIPIGSFDDWLITDAQNMAWNDLGNMTVRGFVLHRQLGKNGPPGGTNAYFRTMGNARNTNAGGLTTFGQDAVTGKVIRWNDPSGAAHNVDYTMSGGKVTGRVSPNRAGWASGPYQNSYGDGLRFGTKYGISAVNRDQISWEIDGWYGDPWSDKAMDVAAQVCAHYAHDYGIPWDQFPIAPQDGFSFVRWHQEFCGPSEKECPGSVVMAQTDTFIGKVKAILKQFQTADTSEPVPPVEPPKPIPVSPYPIGMTEQLARELYGTAVVSWSSKPFAFDLARSECRAWLEFGKTTIPQGHDYRDGSWGKIERVIRRGNKGSGGRVYQYSNGFVYFQAPPSDQKGKAA